MKIAIDDGRAIDPLLERRVDEPDAQPSEILDALPDSLIAIDRDWRITHANAAAEANPNLGRTLLVGRSYWDAVPDAVGTPFEPMLRRAMAERVAIQCEYFNPERERWFELRACPLISGGLAAISRDTTERKLAEAASLAVSHERDELLAGLQRQFARLPLACVVTGPDLAIIDWNASAERVFGYRRDEVIGRDARMLLPAYARVELADLIQRVSRGDLVEHHINANLTKDGRVIQCEWHNSPLRDPAGRQLGVVAMAEDITARVETENRLRHSEQLLAEAQRIARLGSWSYELATGRLTWSDVHYRLVGLTPDDNVPHEVVSGYVHPDDFNRLSRCIDQASHDRRPFEARWRALHADGSIRFMRSRGQVECDPLGVPTRIFGSTQDVTEQMMAERALLESQANLAAELAGMARLQEISTQLVQTGDGAALLDKIVDAAIAITAADTGSVRLLDRATGSLEFVASRGLDGPFLEFFGTAYGGSPAASAALERGARVVVEDITTDPLFVGTPAADVMQAAGLRALQSTPLVSRSGRIIGSLSTHYRKPRRPAERDLGVLDLLARQAADWLEREEVQREREKLLESERLARAEAERATRLKDDFLATLSHELRSPLSAIIGWTEVLKLDLGDAAQVEHGIDVIARAARTQSQLVADLLDLNRIINGKLRLDIQRVNLPDVIAAAVEVVRPAAEARDIHIHCVIDPNAEPVHGDAARLQQVLWNLLSNAVKFTPVSGRVQVVLARVNSQVEITVSDTGKGIHPDFLVHVFDRFRQADASAAREHGGLGIGLALVKELTELHGGAVRAYSEGQGRGSTFAIKLPLAILYSGESGQRLNPRVPAAMSLVELATECLAGVRVLVVDDEPDGLEVMGLILLALGAEVTPARSAADALATLERTQFDVLLSDIGMPKCDGYELIAEVRRRGVQTPAAAVTAFARSEDRTRALLSGFQAHIAKPIEASELVATVASLAGRVSVG